GEDIRFRDGLETELSDGDEVTIRPAVAGGWSAPGESELSPRGVDSLLSSTLDDGNRVAILCGGRGTRLQEHTHAIPKALVEIGGMPILWHVVRIYAAQGFLRFLLLTGSLGEAIEEFVATSPWPETIDVQCVDTGLDTPTGG